MFDFRKPSKKLGITALLALPVALALIVAWSAGAVPSLADDPPSVAWAPRDTNVTVVTGGDSAYLGVRLEEETDLDEGGARVTHVVDDSPADRAGLRRGDVIVVFNGKTIRGPAGLTKQIHETEPGDQASVEIIRDGRRQTLEIEMGKRRGPTTYRYGNSLDAEKWEEWAQQWEQWGEKLGEQFGEEWTEKWQEWAEQFGEEFGEKYGEKYGNLFVCEDDDCSFGPGSSYSFSCDEGDCSLFSVGGRPVLGVELVEVTPELRDHLGAKNGQGVLISKVLANTPAQAAGIRVGDLILTVDGESIESTSDLRRALRDKRGQTFPVELVRDKRSMTVEVTIPEPDDERPTGPRAGLRRVPAAPRAPRAPVVVVPRVPAVAPIAPVAPIPPIPPIPSIAPVAPLPERMVPAVPVAPRVPPVRIDRVVSEPHEALRVVSSAGRRYDASI